MASHTTLTKPQAEILGRFLKSKLPESIDETVKEFGMEEAFRLHQLAERFSTEEDEDDS